MDKVVEKFQIFVVYQCTSNARNVGYSPALRLPLDKDFNIFLDTDRKF